MLFGVGLHSISALAPFLEGFVNKRRVGDGFPSLGIQLLTRMDTTFWASPLQKCLCLLHVVQTVPKV